jgi:hypothetical protein
VTSTRKPGVEVEGARQLRKTLKAAGDDLGELKAAHAAAARLVSAAAAARAPKRTGRLAGTVRGSGAASVATIRAGSAAVRYAQPIHWGWPARNIAPNPFISQAAQATESVWVPLYEREVDHALSKVKGIDHL